MVKTPSRTKIRGCFNNFHRRAVYERALRTMTESLDAHSVAKVIRESRIKPTDFMYEHVFCQLDLKTLRGFFESYGYYDLLPPLSNMYPDDPRPQEKPSENPPVGVSATLETFFPLLSPNDPLVGQNDRARPGALMYRRIVRLIMEMMKRPKERNLAEHEP